MKLIEKVNLNEGIILTGDFKCISENGWFSDLYSNSNGLAVKIPLRDSIKGQTEGKMYKECILQKEIFNKGYPVPEPIGVTEAFPDEDFYSKFGRCWVRRNYRLNESFVMEEIIGHDLSFRGYFQSHIESMMEEAQDLIKSIRKNVGLAPAPLYGLKKVNIMWDEKNDRVVLVDFGNWVRV